MKPSDMPQYHEPYDKGFRVWGEPATWALNDSAELGVRPCQIETADGLVPGFVIFGAGRRPRLSLTLDGVHKLAQRLERLFATMEA